MPVTVKELPSIIAKEAAECDCCLHAGDFITFDTFKKIRSLIKTYGVCGNMDNSDVVKELPSKQILKFEDIKLGLIHGCGSPVNLLSFINKEFADSLSEIDIFVFGHSHFPTDKEVAGKIYFNPGSPTDEIFSPYRSYGILEISGKTIKRRIVKIE